MQTKVDEKELIILISQGDRSAFSLLYRRYLNNISRYIFSICYDDEITKEVVQNLFIKVWENRQHLTHVALIKPYLYRSSKNLLLNYIRNEQLQTRVIELYSHDHPSSRDTIHEKIDYDQYFEITRTAVELLPEKRKQIFKLRSDESLTIDEIAVKLSISRSVVKKQWYKGAIFVREYLYKYGEMTAIVLSMLIFKHQYLPHISTLMA